MLNQTKVDFQYSNNLFHTQRIFNSLPNIIACDFETANRYTSDQRELFKYRLQNQNLDRETYRELLQKYTADGLSHPEYTTITHLSIAWSDHEAFVVICDNIKITQLCYNFLVTTDKLQLWHNASFDWRHIYYNTHKYPKYYLDTQLLAKCILNNANSTLDRTDLKGLMAYKYGTWAIAKDEFTLDNLWDEKMLEYTATDACATYALYEDIQESVGKQLKP